jgi:hypothetical protein
VKKQLEEGYAQKIKELSHRVKKKSSKIDELK